MPALKYVTVGPLPAQPFLHQNLRSGVVQRRRPILVRGPLPTAMFRSDIVCPIVRLVWHGYRRFLGRPQLKLSRYLEPVHRVRLQILPER